MVKIRDGQADRADARQQVQAVAADHRAVGVDLHGGEEGVDGRAEGGHRGHGGGEVFLGHRGGDGGFGGVEGGEKGVFLGRFGEFDVGPVGVFDAVLLLGLRQDRIRALEALDQVRAVGGFEEGGKGCGAVDEQGQVVVPRHGEAGVDDVMRDALIAEEDLEAVVEEGEEVGRAVDSSCRPSCNIIARRRLACMPQDRHLLASLCSNS